MNRSTRENLKKVVLPGALLCLAAIALYLGLLALSTAGFRRENNRRAAAFIEKLHEEYPELSEGELMRLYREAEEGGEEAAARFSYEEMEFLNRDAGAYARRAALAGAGAIALLASVGILVCLMRRRRREREIRELIDYMHEIEGKSYRLKLDENRESELSLLSNEIYKMTVLLREATDQSRRDSENLSRALADISHQLKTPLSAIGIMLDNILEDPEMPEEVRMDFLRGMDSQVTRISELVETLLHLARFDAGTIRMNPEEVTMRGLLGSVLEDLDVLFDLMQVETELSGDLDTPLLLDVRWESEALKNILKNCAEHSPADSTIHVEAADCGMFYRLRIRDEGEGIAREDLPHIFERFYKAKNASASSIGIGLSLAKAVIEQEEGYVSAESEPGQGTTFTIRYPVRRKEA